MTKFQRVERVLMGAASWNLSCVTAFFSGKNGMLWLNMGNDKNKYIKCAWLLFTCINKLHNILQQDNEGRRVLHYPRVCSFT